MGGCSGRSRLVSGSRGADTHAMARYLVTGCAGFVGSHLAESLVAGGHEVVGLDAFTDYYARSIKEANIASAWCQPNLDFFEMDLWDSPW